MAQRACGHCQTRHARVSFGLWSRELVHHKPKPPAGQVAVLLALGTHLEWDDGCGWCYLATLARELTVSEPTVWRAVKWAKAELWLDQPVRGRPVFGNHRQPNPSWWVLRLPAAPRF